MTDDEFIEKRLAFQEEIKAVQKIINEKYTILVQEYLDSNCSYELAKVYDIQGKSHPKGMKRFVVYQRGVETVMGEHPLVRIHGWWLDSDNNPKKWDSLSVDRGIANPAVLTLSENQQNNPVKDRSINY